MDLKVNINNQIRIIMNEFTELNLWEMSQISGGINIAYEIGYTIGSAVRHAVYATGIATLFR